MAKITVRSPEDLIAVVPHVLGFQPEESLVVLGVGAGLPTARVDLPRDQAELDAVLDSLRRPYAKAASSDATVVLVAFGGDRAAAEVSSRAVAQTLAAVGVNTVFELWSHGDRWIDLDTGLGGHHSSAAASQMAATTVAAGRAQPLASRDQLAADLVGDRTPITAALPAARAAAADLDRALGPQTGRAHDQVWAAGRLEEFWTNGNRLSDPDAARLLVALEDKPTRDNLWMEIDRSNATASSALWADLTRRAPDEVRAAPASLLAFSSWLAGDGARAWCALDQVPADQPYPLARLVDQVLESGINPREWDTMRPAVLDGLRDLPGQPERTLDHQPDRRSPGASQSVDESYVPAPRDTAHHRHQGPGRPIPGANPDLGSGTDLGPASPAR